MATCYPWLIVVVAIAVIGTVGTKVLGAVDDGLILRVGGDRFFFVPMHGQASNACP